MQSRFTHYNTAQSISPNWHNIVQGLIGLRHNQGWSQEELAHKIGCNVSLIHKWEQYKRVPSNFLLICWLDALEAEVQIKARQTGQKT